MDRSMALNKNKPIKHMDFGTIQTRHTVNTDVPQRGADKAHVTLRWAGACAHKAKHS